MLEFRLAWSRNPTGTHRIRLPIASRTIENDLRGYRPFAAFDVLQKESKRLIGPCRVTDSIIFQETFAADRHDSHSELEMGCDQVRSR